MKKFKRKKVFNKYIFITLIIIIITIYIISYINTKVSNKLLKISEYTIDIYNNHLIMDFVSNDTLSSLDLNKLINISKNKKDEIIAIDYDISTSYKVLKIITDNLHDIITNTSFKDITDYDYEIKDDLILFYPILLASDYIYFNNLGPKIPVKIKFLSSLVTGLNTKVSNYGINNVLIEIYVDIEIEDDIVIPFKQDTISKKYNVLLASKIVMGSVPSYLGGTIENSSPILYN